MPLPPKTIGIAAALVTVLIWTSFIVVTRASASLTLKPLDIVFARTLGAALVLLPWGWWLVHRAQGSGTAALGGDRSFFGFSPLSFRVTAMTGALGGLSYSTLAFSGFFFAPAAHASVLLPGFLPMWTALLAVLLLREPMSSARLVGLVLILSGGLLVGGPSLLHAFDGREAWKGDLMFLGASFSWSAYAVMARQLRLDAVRATIALTVFMMFSFVPLFLLAVASGLLPSRLLDAPAGELLFQATFQGMLSVALAGITFTTMVRHFGPVRTTMMTAVVPGLSALGAAMLLGEPLGWNLLLGLTLVTLGMLFGMRAPG